MRRSAFTPVFEQLKGIVRAQIAEGLWKPGEKILSERRMAEEYGVARLTATRALNELAAEGVLERRDSHGTFVAADALERLGLSSGRYEGKSPAFGFAVMDVYRMTHPYFAGLAKSLAEHCGGRGRPLHTFSFHAGDIHFRRRSTLSDALAEQAVAGLLLAGTVAIDDMAALVRAGVPVVRVNHETPGAEVPCVLVDYARGAFEMTQRLIALGHRRIALLLGGRTNRASALAHVGYRLAHAAAGVDAADALVTTGHFDEESGYERTRALLRQGSPPTAIQAADDLIACGAMKAAREAGLNVPADVSIAGAGNLISPYATEPSLCTLDIQIEQVAVRAADMLESLVAGAPTPTHVVMPPPPLLERDSIGPARNG